MIVRSRCALYCSSVQALLRIICCQWDLRKEGWWVKHNLFRDDGTHSNSHRAGYSQSQSYPFIFGGRRHGGLEKVKALKCAQWALQLAHEDEMQGPWQINRSGADRAVEWTTVKRFSPAPIGTNLWEKQLGHYHDFSQIHSTMKQNHICVQATTMNAHWSLVIPVHILNIQYIKRSQSKPTFPFRISDKPIIYLLRTSGRLTGNSFWRVIYKYERAHRFQLNQCWILIFSWRIPPSLHKGSFFSILSKTKGIILGSGLKSKQMRSCKCLKRGSIIILWLKNWSISDQQKWK